MDVLLELAQADRAILRQLTARFDVAAAADELVAATRQAIADATDFDARDLTPDHYSYWSLGSGHRNVTGSTIWPGWRAFCPGRA